jgi:hypothetical protein
MTAQVPKIPQGFCSIHLCVWSVNEIGAEHWDPKPASSGLKFGAEKKEATTYQQKCAA